MKYCGLGIIGHLALGTKAVDGQTIKTRVLYEELKVRMTSDEMLVADTHRWQSKVFHLFVCVLKIMLTCPNVIVILSENGRNLCYPLLYYLNRVTRNKIHNVVIGGNLPELVDSHPNWIKYMNSFEGTYVETDSMRERLKSKGIANAILMPNCKKLDIVDRDELQCRVYSRPYKLCFFSRVVKEKGVEDAIEAVIKANEELKEVIYEFDIYGQIDGLYQDAFAKMMRSLPPYIAYKGVVPYDKSVKVLSSYFLLLFPTFWAGEGCPGTIIDALAAGLPVIASDWHYNSEIIKDRCTGRIFPTRDVGALTRLLVYYARHPEQVLEMSKYCVNEAWKYTPDSALKALIDRF